MQLSSVSMKDFRRRFVDEVFRFPLYVITNPFKAFSDIKYEKKGSVPACFLFMFLIMILNVMKSSYTGTVFLEKDPRFVNIWVLMAGALIQTVLLVVANWSVTVLIDGSGSLKEIFMVAMYAQYPNMWLSGLYIVLSHVLSLDEKALLNFCSVFGIVCIVFYAFIGLVSVHGFGFFKGIASVLLTVVALVIIIFVLLMLVSMSGELVTFIKTIYNEIVLHYF